MSEFPVASRPVTRAVSKQNYAAQPVTVVAAVRDKFEKPRGHMKATSTSDEDIDNEFADLQMTPAFPGGETYIGTPTRAKFVAPSSETPLSEIRQRAASVRAALDAAIPKPPVVSCDLEGTELALAGEAAFAFEPTSRDIMNVLGQIAKTWLSKTICELKWPKHCCQ